MMTVESIKDFLIKNKFKYIGYYESEKAHLLRRNYLAVKVCEGWIGLDLSSEGRGKPGEYGFTFPGSNVSVKVITRRSEDERVLQNIIAYDNNTGRVIDVLRSSRKYLNYKRSADMDHFIRLDFSKNGLSFNNYILCADSFRYYRFTDMLEHMRKLPWWEEAVSSLSKLLELAENYSKLQDRGFWSSRDCVYPVLLKN